MSRMRRWINKIMLKFGYVQQHYLVTCSENLQREAMESTRLRRENHFLKNPVLKTKPE